VLIQEEISRPISCVQQGNALTAELSSNLQSTALSENRISSRQTTQEHLQYYYKVNTMVRKIYLIFIKKLLFFNLSFSSTVIARDLSEEGKGDH